jgi:general secretion pathway protein F
MPIFHYKGYAADGSEVKGSIEASSFRDAIAEIKAQRILPTDIIEPTPKKKWGAFRRKDETFLPDMTRQLSIFLDSGVPLMESLQSLSQEYRGSYGEILMAVKDRLSKGSDFSRALQEYPDVFPDYYVHMIQAGEASGTLDAVLIRLADFLEHQSVVRSKLRSAMIYPILMTGVSFVVLSFLFVFVIPKIVRIFTETKSALPLVTKLLVWITNIVTNYWWLIAALMIAIILFAKRYIKNNREQVDGILMRLPGNILQNLYYARFARSMEVLLTGGLPVLAALKLSAKSTGNRSLEALVHSAGERVAEGHAIASSLQGFPPLFVRLVATGEKTGKLAETLKKAASSYDEAFNRKVDRLVSIFEPVMIILMGLVVCFVVLAVLLPIFQLNQLVK